MSQSLWSLIVPVKPLARAKSRIAGDAGPHRPALALAVAADTVTAALACRAVAAVVVVTDDPVAAPELAALGALVVPDEPDRGLNPALVHGASRAPRTGGGGRHGLGALSADLPALRPEELATALDAAAAFPHAFVPDAAGTGTTLYTARPGAEFTPAFGAGSRERHAAAGATAVERPGLAGLRQDVDTLADLRAAAALGLGPRTAAVARLILDLADGRAAAPR